MVMNSNCLATAEYMDFYLIAANEFHLTFFHDILLKAPVCCFVMGAIGSRMAMKRVSINNYTLFGIL